MNKLKCAFLSLSVLFSITLSAQNWKPFKKNAALDCRFFTTDRLQNIYIITAKNEILKYNQDGSFDAQYVNLEMGRLGVLDASNPFKILVYYPDFQSFKLLDKELNTLGTYNLNNLGVARVGSIAMGDDGRVWIYDAGKNKLFTFDNGQTQQVQGGVMPFAGKVPSMMLMRENTLFVNVPTEGVFLFDRFGKYLKKLDLKNVSYFQVIGNQLFFQQNGKIMRYNLQNFATSPLPLPSDVKGDELVRMEKNFLYTQQGKTIVVHQDN